MDFQRYSYVMINGTRSSLNPLVTPNRTSGAVENVYNLFPYQITSYNLSGYYQCAIFNPETMLKPVVSPTSSFISIPSKDIYSDKYFESHISLLVVSFGDGSALCYVRVYACIAHS